MIRFYFRKGYDLTLEKVRLQAGFLKTFGVKPSHRDRVTLSTNY